MQIENFLNINGTETDLNVRFAVRDVPLYSKLHAYWGTISNNLEGVLVNPLGRAGGVFRVKFTTVPSTHGDMVGYGFTVRETVITPEIINRSLKAIKVREILNLKFLTRMFLSPLKKRLSPEMQV